MADVDIDPIGDHCKTDSHPDETGGTIPFPLGQVIEGGSTGEPEQEQETSFRGMSLMMKVLQEHVKALYQVLSEHLGQASEAFHFNDFELRDGKPYYREKSSS